MKCPVGIHYVEGSQLSACDKCRFKEKNSQQWLELEEHLQVFADELMSMIHQGSSDDLADLVDLDLPAVLQSVAPHHYLKIQLHLIFAKLYSKTGQHSLAQFEWTRYVDASADLKFKLHPL